MNYTSFSRANRQTDRDNCSLCEGVLAVCTNLITIDLFSTTFRRWREGERGGGREGREGQMCIGIWVAMSELKACSGIYD